MSAKTPETLLQIAEAVGANMIAGDKVFRHFGFRMISIAPGRVSIEVAVRDDMLNSHDICHGGVIFTLADTAMAMAGNTHNVVAVASGGDINFVNPAKAGEILTAEAVECSLRGRTGLYDVTVTGHEGRLIALFRGRTHRLTAPVVDWPSTRASVDRE